MKRFNLLRPACAIALLLPFIACLPLAASAQARLVIGSGTALVTTGGAVINLQNTDLVVNGTINQQPGQGKYLFSGSGSNMISGSVPALLDVLEVSKPGGGLLSLGQNTRIGSAVTFTAGNLDVGNYILQLEPAATLNGEQNASRLQSGGTGYATITTDLNAPAAADPGNLGAVITSAQNLGPTTVKRGFSSQVNGGGAGSSILRYYDITPTNDAGIAAMLRINYFDSEVNGLDKSLFVLWKSVDNTHWTDQGYTSRDAVADYVSLIGINDLSRWTISTFSNPLPITLLSFTAQTQHCDVLLNWRTAIEENFSHFELERSGNGNNYMKIASIPAKGSNSSYTFEDDTPSQGVNMYRLKIVDLDNSAVYSNIVSATVACSEGIRAYPNPVTGTCRVSGVAPGQRIIIYALTGQRIADRNVNGTIEEFDFGSQPSGIYLIKVIGTDGTPMTDIKILKN